MRTISRLAVVTSLAFVTMLGLRLAWSAHTHPKEVAGLWSRWPAAQSDGDPVRFYFFHEDGIGLYRYGKIGLNTTNSFDWKADGDELVITFRKTGQVVRTRYSVADHVLTLLDDPKEPLEHKVRYAFVPPSQVAGLLEGADTLGAAGKVPGRLWIDAQKFATGGMGFSLYQLRDAGIDGRGVGWHHVGDFDDWSTEALTYRASPGTLELWFTVRGEHAKTRALRNADGDLTLVEDPRNFGHVETYKDAGPSFGSF